MNIRERSVPSRRLMQLTFWDHFVRAFTGKFPSRTQAELDKLVELKAMLAKVQELAAEELAEARAKGLVEDRLDLSPSKKKATPRRRKPSLG
jgi:hypothetical protein